eukprot:765232-Hanusia_phi.AAC.1
MSSSGWAQCVQTNQRKLFIMYLFGKFQSSPTIHILRVTAISCCMMLKPGVQASLGSSWGPRASSFLSLSKNSIMANWWELENSVPYSNVTGGSKKFRET